MRAIPAADALRIKHCSENLVSRTEPLGLDLRLFFIMMMILFIILRYIHSVISDKIIINYLFIFIVVVVVVYYGPSILSVT